MNIAASTTADLCSGLQPAIEMVQFDQDTLSAAVDELLTVRPDALGARDVGTDLPASREDLMTAVGHALAVAGALNVAARQVDPVQTVLDSGLFDPQQGAQTVRFKALALDYALGQALEMAGHSDELLARLSLTRAKVRELASVQLSCDDAGLWTYLHANQ